ncbi:hypothetical protein BDR04DRAFT_1130203 [Suillus decipiens]|nr:hypothetical protein BDR04DRAFT_1130203 [Suillus decipiens]
MLSFMFPHLVPDQYRELMRLKTMKWHGFGHHSDDPKVGDLILFCPACPQPGINIWKYTWSFVMDGNFKAEHLHPIKPHDEASDMVEKLSCNNHQAINQANAVWHKLESMGIGGVACAQHGCFTPHSMVDFQKGERQAKHAVPLSRDNHASLADK